MAAGKVTLQRGTLIYCLEQADNDITPLSRVAVPARASISARHEPALLGGVTVLEVEGYALDDADWEGTFYRTDTSRERSVTLRAVPYYAWDNRAAGQMAVWLRELD